MIRINIRTYTYDYENNDLSNQNNSRSEYDNNTGITNAEPIWFSTLRLYKTEFWDHDGIDHKIRPNDLHKDYLNLCWIRTIGSFMRSYRIQDLRHPSTKTIPSIQSFFCIPTREDRWNIFSLSSSTRQDIDTGNNENWGFSTNNSFGAFRGDNSCQRKWLQRENKPTTRSNLFHLGEIRAPAIAPLQTKFSTA